MRPNSHPALRGMTWDHPRGFDPLVACSRQWRERTGLDVSWERRSLQDFESYPVQTLAQQYDLIVIDHPHVGQITREACLLPLEATAHGNERAAVAQNSVGTSFESYVWEGRLWALPIDAAAQVQAWRPDRLAGPAADWPAMLQLARQGRVQCPLRPPHNLMTLYTLCGLLGCSGNVTGPELIEPRAGAKAYELMQELLSYLDLRCLSMDPIAVFEAMSQESSPIECVPLIYGYVSYAHDGFRPARIAFADIPVIHEDARPVGSALGGTGIAVSAYSSRPDAAMDFAYWIASADVQRGPYARAGGQPGNAAAWADPAVNHPVFDFYVNTRATLEGSWVRPRHDGYMRFQDVASQRLQSALRSGEPADAAVAALNGLFRESLNKRI
jgi:multiple sugar transport system substrate-binding protein